MIIYEVFNKTFKIPKEKVFKHFRYTKEDIANATEDELYDLAFDYLIENSDYEIT